MSGCCTETIPIPEWVKLGASVKCRVPILTTLGTIVEPSSRGIICHVDEWGATVVGIEGQYPGLQVVQSGPEIVAYWEPA